MALAALGMALVIAACGSGNDNESSSDQETVTSPGGGVGGESVVSIAVDPDATLAYQQEAVEASAGEIQFDLDNPARLAHDLRIEGPDGEDLGGTPIISADGASVTLELDPGQYSFYCSVPGHREAGMEGPLTIA